MRYYNCRAKIVERIIEEPPIDVKYPEVRGLINKAVEKRINQKINI